MNREESRAKILNALTERADAEGFIVGYSLSDIYRDTGISPANASPAVSALVREGELTRIARGAGCRATIYRLGGVAEPVAKPFVNTLGIETVVRWIPDHRWQGHGIPTRIPVTLPRLRCLEGVE